MARITLRLSDECYGKLQDMAGNSRRSISKVIRQIIVEGLDRLDSKVDTSIKDTVPLSRDLLEEILVTVFGMEDLIVRSYDPQEGTSADMEEKREILKRVASRAREKSESYLGRARS